MAWLIWPYGIVLRLFMLGVVHIALPVTICTEVGPISIRHVLVARMAIAQLNYLYQMLRGKAERLVRNGNET